MTLSQGMGARLEHAHVLEWSHRSGPAQGACIFFFFSEFSVLFFYCLFLNCQDFKK